MSRRWIVLTGALAIALAAPQATAAVASPGEPDQQRVRPERASDSENGLARLRADAVGRLKVHRATDGAVDFVSSTNGRAMLDGDEGATPRRSAQDQLARYGETFGIDGGLSRAVVKQTLDSSTGGSIVRADQVVDGVPVFGGQIVMSLDEDQGVVSMDTATTEATEVPAARGQRGEGAARGAGRHGQEPQGRRRRAHRDRQGSPALRPRHRAHLRPHGRPTGLGVRGHQRLRDPGAGPCRHRPRRDRPALQRRTRDQPRGL